VQDNTTSLLFRQRQHINASHVLVVNPVDELPALLINEGVQIDSWYLHAGRFRKAHAKENAVLVPWLTAPQSADLVIVILPKEKALTALLMSNLASQIKPGTPLLLVGHKDTGIKSQLKCKHPGWAPFQKLASGNHCQLLYTQLEQQQSWSADDQKISYLIDTPGGQLPITAYPGVFSPDRLDPGTRMLLTNLPDSIRGKVLDFGCGTGVISLWLLMHYENLQLTASDVNPLAIAAAKQTLSGFDQASFTLSDGLSDVTGRFDWIITNPPFHTGKNTDYSITRNFVEALPQHLQTDGKVILVANSFLPYQQWLNDHFRNVNVIQRDNRFTLYQASGLRKRSP